MAFGHFLSIFQFYRVRGRTSCILFIGFSFCCVYLLYLRGNSHLETYERLITLRNSITQNASVHWPLDHLGRSVKAQFLALDLTGFFGSAEIENQSVSCLSTNTKFIWTRKLNRLDRVDFLVAHSVDNVANMPLKHLKLSSKKQQYSLAFIMESEVHSTTGSDWAKFNFKMSYNLDDSYPEPATYFDMNNYIIDLLQPVSVAFEEKEQSADIVWIISNCNAHNGREYFVRELMSEMKIDSYGSCLKNRVGHETRMQNNIDVYRTYKFIIAIENSNCYDYVTEKLVKTVVSGSIPIVAGRMNRPDYQRFLPDHSYINVFDYASIKDLAADLKRIANNKTLYESYLWFKNHNIDLNRLRTMSLDQKIKIFSQVIGENSTMLMRGIVRKEKSENKICKLIRFIHQTPWRTIANHNRTARMHADKACLPSQSLVNHFSEHKSTINEASGSENVY